MNICTCWFAKRRKPNVLNKSHLWAIHWFFSLHWPLAGTTSVFNYMILILSSFNCMFVDCIHVIIVLWKEASTHQVIWFLSWWVPDNDHSMLHLDSVREHWPLLKSPLFINLWEKPHNRTISTANPFPIPELLIWLQSTLNIRTNTSLLFNMLSVETLTLTRTW